MMFTTVASNICSQGSKIRTDPVGDDTEQCQKSIWKKEASNNINVQWMVD